MDFALRLASAAVIGPGASAVTPRPMHKPNSTIQPYCHAYVVAQNAQIGHKVKDPAALLRDHALHGSMVHNFGGALKRLRAQEREQLPVPIREDRMQPVLVVRFVGQRCASALRTPDRHQTV